LSTSGGETPVFRHVKGKLTDMGWWIG
jgi:hypothetical protein